MKLAAVYIMSKGSPRGRLYLAATADLRKRLWAHRHALPGHPIINLVDYELVYFELLETFHLALKRGQEILRCDHLTNREMILRLNPQWRDLSGQVEALAG